MGLATIIVFKVARDEYLADKMAPEALAIAALIDRHAVGVARQIAASWELSERIDAALAEQREVESVPASPLGRALRFGEFLGALAVLRGCGAIDDQTSFAVLHSVETPGDANERIWARMGFKSE